MILWFVFTAAVAWECPRWANFLGLQAPGVCRAEVKRSWSVTSYRSEMERRVRESSGEALVLKMEGGRVGERKVTLVYEVDR